jgi:hypothetical protein
MRVFYIKGFSGLMMFLLAAIGLLALVVALPTSFMMVLWNALIFEGLGGPEIDMGQALILWGAVMVLIKLIANPQISFQFRRATNAGELERFKKTDKEK